MTYGSRRTSRDSRNQRIVDALVTASSMNQDEILFVLEHLQNRPEGVTAFKNFAIKSKLLFADELGEIRRAETKRMADAKAFIHKRDAEAKTLSDNIGRLVSMIQSNSKLTAQDIPQDLSTTLEICIKSKRVKYRWFKYLCLNERYPISDWDLSPYPY